MRPLDRLFGALAYPYDVLLPSLAWLSVAAAAMLGIVFVARRTAPAPWRPLRIGLWCGAADACLWLGVVAARALHEGASPSWLAPVEATVAAARGAIDAVLWNAIGVSAAVDPALLFRGYSSWTGTNAVLVASILNEAAFVALLGAAAAAICRRAAGRASRP